MKKLIIAITFLSFFAIDLEAQNRGFRGEARQKVEEYRVQYFNRNLDLSPKEAEAFWPIYNSHQKKQEQLRESNQGRRKIELMSDADVEKSLIEHLESKQKLLDLEKDFFRQVKTVLPIRKVALLPKVEKQFKKDILQEMRERRQGNRGNRGRRGIGNR